MARRGTGVHPRRIAYPAVSYFETPARPCRAVHSSERLVAWQLEDPYADQDWQNLAQARLALDGRSNRVFNSTVGRYGDPAQGQLAPPILVFEHPGVDGRTKGYRRLAGFGVPTGVRLQTQTIRDGRFTNLAIELALFGAFVTAALFADPAQRELMDDDHTMLLNDGMRVAEEVQKELVSEGMSLERFLQRETAWYDSCVSHFGPERILSQDGVGSSAWPHCV